MPSHAAEAVKIKPTTEKRARGALLWWSWNSRRSTTIPQAQPLPFGKSQGFECFVHLKERKRRGKTLPERVSQGAMGLVTASQARNGKGLHLGHWASLHGAKWEFGSPGSGPVLCWLLWRLKAQDLAASRCQHLCHLMRSKLSRRMEANGAAVANCPSTLTVVLVVDLSGTPPAFVMFPSTTGNPEELAIPEGKLVSLYQPSVALSSLSK